MFRPVRGPYSTMDRSEFVPNPTLDPSRGGASAASALEDYDCHRGGGILSTVLEPVVAGPTPWNLPWEDLERSLERSETDLRRWDGSRFLITGGTGYLGSWIVASLLHAIDRLNLDLHLTLVSRDPGRVPLEPGPTLTIRRADVRDQLAVGPVDFVIHGAASSSAIPGIGDGKPDEIATTIINGTRSMLEAANHAGARVLFLSSGAVYGPQTEPVSEDHLSGPDPMVPGSIYGQAKRMAEALCAVATESGDVPVVVSRLFSFVGPRLPLDIHYAAGNFIRAILDKQPIVVKGDGRPLRSYLYSGDLPEWCWTLLARGVPGRAYNVGSPEALTIRELAGKVASISGPISQVEVLGKPSGGLPECYVPIIERAQLELALTPRTSLSESLRRTYEWYSSN